MKNCFDRKKAKFDRFNAFHHTIGHNDIVIFDTGEAICTTRNVHVDNRHRYHDIDLECSTTQDTELWMPNGTRIAKAWVTMNGMQHLLIDHGSKRAVSIAKPFRSTIKEADHVHGIPARFQKEACAYIGGEGCMPVGGGTITAHLPHKVSCTPEQLEHLAMLESTFRAAMKLTDDPCTHQTNSVGGLPFDIAFKCKDWQDVPLALRHGFFAKGVAREVREFDYLLIEPPAKAS